MASDKQRYVRALEKWDALNNQQCFSVPESEGRVAILCSNDAIGGNVEERKREIDYFEQEAWQISYDLEQQSIEAVIYRRAQPEHLDRVMRNESIASVVTIGHGALSVMNVLGPYDVRDAIDWLDVSAASTHLKTGFFEQRHCGKFARHLSIPLGLFAMRSHSSVIAPVGQYFSPENLGPTEEQKLRPVCDVPRVSPPEAIRLFGRGARSQYKEEES